MATRLKNILTFTNVVAGATSAPIPHLLNIDGLRVTPDKLEGDTPGFSLVADATNVTVLNNTGVTASINVFVEHWYSPDRVFGADQTLELSPQPFVTTTGGVGGGANPGLSVIILGAATIPNTGVLTSVPFNGLVFGRGTAFTQTLNQLIAQVTGMFLITFAVSFDPNATGDRTIILQEDGTNLDDGRMDIFPPAVSRAGLNGSSVRVQIKTPTTYELFAAQTSGAATLGIQATMSIIRLSA